VTAEEYFAGHPAGRAVFAAVRDLVEGMGGAEIRTTKSRVAFRRRRGFAHLWPPGRYLARPGADVVLSVVLGRRDDDPRWKQVVRPTPAHWMHHLEVHDVAEIDEQVAGRLGEAYDRAG
jgi:hypothetical protein